MSVILQQACSAQSTSNCPVYQREFPEAASQSFKKGQMVYLVSGLVTVSAGTDTNVIAGMAMRDASGTTNTMIPVALPVAPNIFLMNVYHATPASAITAVTQPGTKFGMKVTGNKCYVAIDDTSTTQLLVTALYEGDAVGDQYGRLWVEVLTDMCQLTSREKTA